MSAPQLHWVKSLFGDITATESVGRSTLHFLIQKYGAGFRLVVRESGCLRLLVVCSTVEAAKEDAQDFIKEEVEAIQ